MDFNEEPRSRIGIFGIESGSGLLISVRYKLQSATGAIARPAHVVQFTYPRQESALVIDTSANRTESMAC